MKYRADGTPRCQDCAQTPEPARTRCSACAARRRDEDAATREERRQRAACLTCGKRVVRDRRYCRAHLLYYRARDAVARAERRRGT
jgi:hypothetical protein